MNTELMNKFRKPVLIVLGVILAYALIGFVILPAILKSKLPEMVETETGRKATLEQVKFNPFSLELSLLGFSMQEKDPQTFVSFDKFFVNVQVWASIKEFALVLDEVSLKGLYARFEMLPEGQYNFSDLLNGTEEEVEEKEDEGEIFPLIINHINLVQGELEIIDSFDSKPDNTLIQDLNLQLQNFSTLQNDESKLGFSLALNTGGVLDWQGDMGINPLFSNGTIKLEGLKFARIWKQFLQHKVAFKWEEGTQLVSFDYAFSYANDEASFQLTEGRLLTEGLKFTLKNSTEKLIDIPYFLVDDINFDLNKQTVSIAKIESREIDFDAWYNAAGELNLQTAFASQSDSLEVEDADPANSEQQTEDVETKPWDVNIQEIALTGSKFNYSDKRKQQHALIHLAALNIGLKNYHLLAGESLQMTAEQGFINLDDLMLKTNQDMKLFHIPNFQINEVDFNLSEQKVNIQSINSRNIFINAWLEKNGNINYQRLFASTPTETKKTQKQPSENDTGKPWKVNIQDIAFNSSKIKFSDKSKKQPIFFNINALDIGIKNSNVLAGKALQMTGNQGYLKLNGFELETRQDPKLISVPNLQVSGLEFNLQQQNLSIKSVTTRDAVIKAWLAKNGEINYQTLFAPPASEQAQQTPPPASSDKNEKPWQVALGEFKIDNYAIEFTDHTTKKPVALNLSELNFSINNFNNKKGTKLPLSFSTQFNKQGKIKISGQSILEPFSSNLELAISNIALNNFQPYINQSARLDIIGGRFNTQGKLAISMPEGGDLKLNYKGGMNIKSLHTRDQILKQDFLNWEQLKLSGLDFNLQPGKLKIKTINLDKPYARVTIKKDKSTNINDVIVEAEKNKSKKKPAKKAKSQSTPFVYNIAKVAITGGESDFSDYSLILPFVVKLNALEGAIHKISSHSKTKTKLRLRGKTFDLSPVDIQGNFNANLDDLDIALHYKSLPLPFLSPYMVEFTGNKIEKGKLSLDLMYTIEKGKLSAKNNVLIDQLKLGEKVESPNAIDLPLGLAIALLKDKDGKIDIKMPLQGSMDDPEFSIGPVLWDTFLNLITKAVTSPFSAIGSFLGSDEDFSVVTFKAGSAELSADEIVKLDGLSSALAQKPDLSLEIKGEAYTNQDWPAMKEQALLDELKQMRSDELKAEGEMKLPEYIELSADDYQRLLADLFIQKFPELGERSLFGTPQLIHEDMGEFSSVASNMLQGLIKPDNDKLLRLSLTRARNIVRYMNTNGKVDHARMFILDGRVVPDATNNELSTHLSLKM